MRLRARCGAGDRHFIGRDSCRPRRRLSVPADHADPAARRRRRHGHPGARAVRAEAQGAARQADRHREPHRRRHGDRRDRDGESAARRLHAVLRAGRHAHHQRHALQEAALRSGKDFTPIALTSSVAFVLVVHPSLPVHSIKELIAYVKERPGQLAFGSTGIGATPHLAVEMIMRDAGLKMTHVPYRGMPQAVNDVVGNHVQMAFADPAGAPPLIKDGKLRPLAVSSLQRIGSLPDVPTMDEAGFKGFEAVSWHMIVGPAGMPKEIVDRLHGEFKRIVDVAGLQGAGRAHGTDRDRFAAAGGAQELSRQGDRALGPAREGRRHRGDGMMHRTRRQRR